MKQNLRKILAMLVLTITVLGLTACGSAASETGLDYDQAQLQAVSDALIEVWDAMSVEDIDELLALDEEDMTDMIEYYEMAGSPFGYFTAESMSTAFASYESSIKDLGAYVSTIGYDEPIVKGDEVTLNTHVQYENREATLSIVFNHKGVAQSVTLDPKYNLGEILAKAGMNTILGMGTVFIVLIFISLVIYCFNFIPSIQAKFSRKKKAEEAPKAAPAPAKAAPAPAAAAEELVDDGELVAAITAAICAYSGTSSDGFVVRSIRRAESATWKRA